jgi:hypothetical protein
MTRRVLGGLVAGLSLWLVIATGTIGAGAQPYESSGITLSNENPAPGGPDTVTASGYQPGSTATFLIFSSGISLATATVNADGTVSDTVIVPSSFAPGSAHTFEVQGTAPDGSALTQSAGVTLIDVSSSGSLAFTGADIAGMAVLGVVVIALGVFLVIVARRRRAANA